MANDSTHHPPTLTTEKTIERAGRKKEEEEKWTKVTYTLYIFLINQMK